ncbi:MAG: hypothetical protein II826_09790 [Prevotella sp.]|nr:hypothetical protein [Prevotella sp.]
MQRYKNNHYDHDDYKPIYDVASKYLMDDERVVKILLSALLWKTAVEVTTRCNELMIVEREPVSAFCLDCLVVTVDNDGRQEQSGQLQEQNVLIRQQDAVLRKSVMAIKGMMSSEQVATALVLTIAGVERLSVG